MSKIAIFLGLTALLLPRSDAICGVCNANGVSCISKTEFHLCFDGVADTSSKYSCQTDEICTGLSLICLPEEQATSIVSRCDNTAMCGVCEGVDDFAFTCTSRTTFTMCLDGQLTDQRGSCPAGRFCDGSLHDILCVETCDPYELTLCDLETAIDAPAPVETTTTSEATTAEMETTASASTVTTPSSTEPETTTPSTETETTPSSTETTSSSTETESSEPTDSSSTTEEETTTVIIQPTPPISSTVTETETPEPTTTEPTTTTLSPLGVCAQHQSVGRYAYADETDCSGYVYCFWKAGALAASTIDCPTGRYFNMETSTCELEKPSWCD